MSSPLFAPQREKAGSQTFSKYSYQYHWALEKALTEHQNRVDYAIFVELHEDVVYSTSLEQSKAEFKFNQIKTDGSSFTKTKLTKLKDGRSVLGKLIEGTSNKPYSGKITEINLVAVNGFGLKLKNPDLKLQQISVDDIDIAELKSIADKLQKEIAGCVLPATLNFVVPTLKEENHQKVLIGVISELISALFPNSSYDSTHIYQLLIDDLFRKGQDTFDYKNWEDSLDRKALTSQKVTATINEYTSHKKDAVIEVQFLDIMKELGYNTIESKEIRRAFARYKNQSYGSRSAHHLKISHSIRASIAKHTQDCSNEFLKLLNLVQTELLVDPQATFSQEHELIGAIIYEFITIE